MGEEEKKKPEVSEGTEEKKMEKEEKKTEEVKKPEEDKKKEEVKEEKKTEEAPPPPPPQEIILRVFMHCEGCARKVRRCLKGFEGVEDVLTDCKTHKVVVKGEKADPVKVLQRIQRKSHRQVELLSPIPKPPAEEPKVEVKEAPKPEEKKEPQVITVVLKVYMHCEGCGQEIKKRIQRMKGVEKVEPDLKSSQVTVKGVFDPPQLVEYIYKRTGKHAVIVKPEPEKKKESDDKEKEGKEVKEEKKKVEEAAAPPEEKKVEEAAPPAEKQPAAAAAAAAEEKSETAAAEKEESNDESKMVEMRNEFQNFYPQNYQIAPHMFPAEMQVHYPYPPAPQIFSDENPNACSVM